LFKAQLRGHRKPMTSNTPQTCILIAGMHRSGTSALSRVLGLLGCAHAKNQLPASETNTTGYWESALINELNNEILESAGSGWDDWAACAPSWFDSPLAEGFKAKALKVYRQEYGDAPLSVLKDPRICRLLPFWLPLLKESKFNVFTLIPIRNPKEVAASLAKRDKSDLLYNQLLWLRHVLDAEAGSRGEKRAFLLYEDLIENHAATLVTIEGRLGLKWPRQSARVSEEIEAYLSPKYRNEHLTTQSVLNDPEASQWLKSTYEIMMRWAVHGESDSDYEALDQILAELNQSAHTFGRVVYRGKTAMVERDRERAESKHIIEQLNHNLSGIEAKHAEERVQTETKNQLLITGLQETFALAEADNQVLSTRLRDAEIALDALEQSRRSQMFEINHLKSALAQKKAETDDYLFQLAKVETEKAEMANVILNLKEHITSLRTQGGTLARQIQELVKSLNSRASWSFLPQRFKRSNNQNILNAANIVDAQWYLEQNPDVAAAGFDPVRHYGDHGANEGRSPSPDHEAVKSGLHSS
jgi:hypothetical protein